jgi:hypothetical protein
VTADEIRAIDVPHYDDSFRDEIQRKGFVVLREIAAQLAELNALLRAECESAETLKGIEDYLS